MLQNPVSFVGFSIVLWRFFYYRTRGVYLYHHALTLGASADMKAAEERALVRFFGQDYENYRRRVRTWIPFVP